MGTIQKQDVPDFLRGENQWETPANTQLYDAASKGNLSDLRDALDKGANANFISKRGDMLGTMHAAARSSSNMENGSARCVKELIESGARVSACLISNRNEPIHEAANVGAKDVCEVLVAASPKCVESENSFGNTALIAATRSGSADVITLLLDKGADCNKVNHRGSTALHVASFLASTSDDVADPYLKIAALLLGSDKIDVDIADVSGYTPLHISAQRGCNNLVKLLIDNGANLTAKTSIDAKGRGGRTPLGMAIFGGQDSTKKIIEEAMAQKS